MAGGTAGGKGATVGAVDEATTRVVPSLEVGLGFQRCPLPPPSSSAEQSAWVNTNEVSVGGRAVSRWRLVGWLWVGGRGELAGGLSGGRGGRQGSVSLER